MHATLGLAASHGAQFGIGAACGTALALVLSGERDASVAEVAASVGVVVGVAAAAFTLIAETLGPTAAVVALGTFAGFAITAFVVAVITITVTVAVTVAVTLIPLIFLRAIADSINRR